ncbi:hypothetical protein FAZ19_14980 [Sphingobacterium alkalisoli]|uniref:Fibronectin type-III domain-containing protein n=1 Tax=Sphingobacterium alkalisoli TaxID=1874115 RepID=A0A4V5LY34_9SPHI|nr:hypothetical protein [Sphingobacterium alkalisoli]TJY64499.1 hypothetical protein FAZ19_14980 [Sphingobacterium alkalisoli]GGH21390.1 hypothetical protein GCM10011418_27210 [Sphingobacterium alkalisoli]
MIKYICYLLLFLFGCGKSPVNPPEQPEKEEPVVLVPTLSAAIAGKVTTTKALLKTKIEHTGGASITERGICWATHNEPTVDDFKASPSTVSGSGEFEVELTNLIGGKKYYARAYASNSAGRAYGNALEFTTESYEDAKLSATSVIFYKLNSMQASAAIETDGGADVLEAGICFAETQNPTIDNQVAKAASITNGAFKVDVTNLGLGKTFYAKSYVKTAKGIFYGSQASFQTFTKGKITVKYHNQANIPAEVFTRLKAMADQGVKLLEEHTSIVKTVTIEYNTGVATADASFTGWMRWGSNASYQRAGTFLHEFSHAIGSGTTSYWTATLLKNGLYTGASANLALQKATNDPATYLRGDGQHWWPYGINGAHEDTGKESDYIVTTLILEGFKRDGIPVQ